MEWSLSGTTKARTSARKVILSGIGTAWKAAGRVTALRFDSVSFHFLVVELIRDQARLLIGAVLQGTGDRDLRLPLVRKVKAQWWAAGFEHRRW